MNAKEIKADILWHVLIRLHFLAAITECGHGCIGIADVFAIQSSGYTYEFEVKTSKADLMGEIKSIRALTEEVDLFSGDKRPHVAKYSKHSTYLKGSKTYTDEMMGSLEMVPNRFFFAVPPELKDVALEGLKGTPYGLYVISEKNNECVKRADLLHKKKASDSLKLKMLHSAAIEVAVARRAIAKGLRCTKCLKSLPTRCEGCEDELKKSRDYTRRSNKCWKMIEDMPMGPERSASYQACMAQTKSP